MRQFYTRITFYKKVESSQPIYLVHTLNTLLRALAQQESRQRKIHISTL